MFFTSSAFPLLNWGIFSLTSSDMIGNFPAALNFNRSFLKLNRFICNKLPVLLDHCSWWWCAWQKHVLGIHMTRARVVATGRISRYCAAPAKHCRKRIAHETDVLGPLHQIQRLPSKNSSLNRIHHARPLQICIHIASHVRSNAHGSDGNDDMQPHSNHASRLTALNPSIKINNNMGLMAGREA